MHLSLFTPSIVTITLTSIMGQYEYSSFPVYYTKGGHQTIDPLIVN